MARKVIDEPSEEIVANAKNGPRRQTRPVRVGVPVHQAGLGRTPKVVTPTRKELLSYTGVVLVFVVIMMALVSALDWVFALVVTYVFGTPAVDTVPPSGTGLIMNVDHGDADHGHASRPRNRRRIEI